MPEPLWDWGPGAPLGPVLQEHPEGFTWRAGGREMFTIGAGIMTL